MGCGVGFPAASESHGNLQEVTLPVRSKPSMPLRTFKLIEPRPLHYDERARAWHGANFYAATSEHAKPIALWIIGPSSVGKTTLAALTGTRYGIPELACDSPGSDVPADHNLDAVFIDGEFMRREHAQWNDLICSEGWRSAYPLLKKTFNAEKDQMFVAAARSRKHLIIPHTGLQTKKTIKDMQCLAKVGYCNHVVAVLASLEDCHRRGRAREVKTGKRYQPSEFKMSLSAIVPMIEACDGRFEVLEAHEEPLVEGERPSMSIKVLVAGEGGSSSHATDHGNGCSENAKPAFDLELRAAIQGEVARYLPGSGPVDCD